MRTVVLVLLVALLLVCATSAWGQRRRSRDAGDDEESDGRGREQFWSYVIFFVFTLLTVYFVFRGNKRA